MTDPTFIINAAEVHTYIVSFTAGNLTAEAKMKLHANNNNGRLSFKALLEHYKGVGMNSIDILRADSILEICTIKARKIHTCGGSSSRLTSI